MSTEILAVYPLASLLRVVCPQSHIIEDTLNDHAIGLALSDIMPDITVGLHWLELTVKTRDFMLSRDILDDFRFNDFKAGAGSMYGYNEIIYGSGGVMLLTHPKKDDHHVIIPGRWLSEVGEDSLHMLKVFSSLGCHYTRVDIACDNYDIYPTPKDVLDHEFNKEIVSRFRTRNSIHNHQSGSVTFYLGSMKGDRFLRVYDKSKESEGITRSTRWEIVLRRSYADQCVEFINKSGIVNTFKGTLLNMLDFRKATTQQRESRRKRIQWYDDFLRDIEEAHYLRYFPVLTIERMEHWLQKQVSRTLATVVYHRKGDMSIVDTMLDIGKQKTLRLR